MNTFFLIIGLFTLTAVLYDFFYTTLSGSGAGIISEYVIRVTFKILRVFSGKSRKIFTYTGMFVNLSVLLAWSTLLWLGLLLVFSYYPSGITNSDSEPANLVERLYYTGYVLSTLGIGNFKPVTPFFEVMTAIFSFFGFIFFTTSMTYLISVSSAVIRKRTLSRSISTLGKNPSQIAERLKNLQPSYQDQQILSLQQQITSHLVSHQAYPVVHFFSHENQNNCFSINFVRLDEAMTILLKEDTVNYSGSMGEDELNLLRSTMNDLLMHLKDKFIHSFLQQEDSHEFQNIEKVSLNQRRKLLKAMLKSEKFDWNYVN